MRHAHFVIVVLAAGVAVGAQAAPPDVKPGLWERTVTRQMEGAPVSPVADRSKLPPEQRARVDSMLSTRGVTAPTTAVVRVCLTAEAARRWESFAREDGDDACERKVDAETAQSFAASLVCAGGRQKGTVSFTAVDAERIRGTITRVQQADGAERTTTVVVESRWLSSDCGAVRPGAPQPVKG